jgi:Domain of unknown function (DUF4397)
MSNEKERPMRRLATVGILTIVVTALGAGAALAAEGESRLTIIHAIPAEGGFPADIYLDGELVVEEMTFGNVTETTTVASGSHSVAIYPAGADPATDDPALAAEVDLADGADATVVAGLTNAGDPTLAVYVNNADPVGAGQARIVLRHQAEAPAVDLLINGEPVALEVANGEEASAEVEAGAITLSLVPSAEGGGDLFQTDVDLSEGSAFLIYGIGSVEGGSFDVAVQVSGLQTPPEGIPTGTGGAASATVPIWLLGAMGAAAVVGSLALSRLARR